jgi:hypothetical protein
MVKEKKKKNRIIKIILLILLSVQFCFSQKNNIETDSVIVWESFKVDSLSLRKVGVLSDCKIWKEKSDTLRIFYNSNIKSGNSISIIINNQIINKDFDVSYWSATKYITTIPKIKLGLNNHIKLIVGDNKFNFSIPYNQFTKSIILTTHYKDTDEKNLKEVSLIVRVMEFDVIEYLKKLNVQYLL